MSRDIHSLELEFAKNPNLDVCIPLVEAYLANRRFMEAMVVCKKGIKTAPNDPRGRVALARVYLEQGKLPKADQELAGVMQAFPGNAMALELQGRLAMLQGNAQGAVALLQQALMADPNLVAARGWLQEMGVAATGMASAPSPVVAAPRPTVPGGMAAAHTSGMPTGLTAAAGPPALPPLNQGGAAMAPGWGAPGITPAAAGHTMPGATVPGQAGTGTFEEPPPAGAQEITQMEHVSDFFAPDALGFSNDLSDIETAGPGRLTILGFVPKRTGSIKTTIVVGLAVFSVAAAVIAWQVVSGQNQRKIAQLYTQIRDAIEEDKYYRYLDAIRLADDVFQIDSGHDLTLSAVAFAYAALAVDHEEPGAVEQGRVFYGRAQRAVGDAPNEHVAAAGALLDYQSGRLDEGYAKLKVLFDRKASSVLLEMEAFRLLHALRPRDATTEEQLTRFKRMITGEPRAFNFVGWHHLALQEWSAADSAFSSALQSSREHPQALLGAALVKVGRLTGLKELQKEVESNVKKVLAIPKEELSQPVLAKAYFTRSQIETWRGNEREARGDFERAVKYHNEPLFHQLRGQLLLSIGQATKAVEYLKRAARPQDAASLKRLVRAQIGTKDLSGARASLSQLSKAAPDDGEVYLLWGRMHLANRRWRDAMVAFKRVDLKKHGAEIYTRAKLGQSTAMRQSGDRKAARFVEDYLSNAPDGVSPQLQAELWAELGLNYEAIRDKSKAQECYQISIEQYPYFPDVHYYVAKASRGGEARRACERYLTLAPRGNYVNYCRRVAKR